MMIKAAKANEYSIRNRLEIERLGRGSCYSCVTVYSSKAIRAWTDDGQTAICPRCGVDAVIPGGTTSRLLNAAHRIWFSRKPPATAGEKS